MHKPQAYVPTSVQTLSIDRGKPRRSGIFRQGCKRCQSVGANLGDRVYHLDFSKQTQNDIDFHKKSGNKTVINKLLILLT